MSVLFALFACRPVALDSDYVYAPTCAVEDDAGSVPDPTWADVAPIVQERCTGCHHDGGSAPFPLTTYDDVAAAATSVRASVVDGTMPPWPPTDCGECGTYLDSRSLEADERDLLIRWVDGGLVAADGDADTPLVPSDGLALARVDVTLAPEVAYVPDPAEADDYRCFVLDPELVADRYVTGFELHPGDPAMVHHMVLATLDTDDAAREAEALEAESADPGYRCFGGVGVDASRFVAGWAPGSGAKEMPPDTGVLVEAGRPLVMQIHYWTGGGVGPDLTTLDLMLEAHVDHRAEIVDITNDQLSLQPGEPEVVRSTTTWADGDGVLYGLAPHMHLLGSWFRIDLTRDGETTCLMDLPRWDFNWQGFFFFEEPVEVLEGDRIDLHCAWDTTGQTEVMEYGDGTEDEMCVAILYVAGG